MCTYVEHITQESTSAVMSNMPPKQEEEPKTMAVDNGAATESEPALDRSLNRFNIINLLGFIANALVTFGIGNLGWNNRPDNGELSRKYQTIVTPWGAAFSIWGPIFIIQLFWCLWQLLPSQRNRPGVFAVGYLYLVVCLAQVGWTLSFSYEIIWLSLIMMYAICVPLLWAVSRLQKVPKIWKGYFLWQFPISLHCGWICAASAVNTNVVLVAYGASAPAQVAVASASLVVLLGVAVTFLMEYPVDLTPPLVLVWALGGVYGELQSPLPSIVARFSEKQISGFQTGTIVGAGVILGLVLLKIVYVLLVTRRRNKPSAAGHEEAV